MVQRSAARCCFNNYSRQPGIVTNMLEKLEWPSLEGRRKLSRLTTFHRVVSRKVDTERDNCIPQEMVILCSFTPVVTSMQVVSSHGLLVNIKNNDILRLPFATILIKQGGQGVEWF